MGKILAIIFLVGFLWFLVPHIAKAQWFGPTLYPSYWWGADNSAFQYEPATYQRGYGWLSFNIFGGRPSVQAGYIAPQRTYYANSYTGSAYGGYYGTTGPAQYYPSTYRYQYSDWGDFGNW